MNSSQPCSQILGQNFGLNIGQSLDGQHAIGALALSVCKALWLTPRQYGVHMHTRVGHDSKLSDTCTCLPNCKWGFCVPKLDGYHSCCWSCNSLFANLKAVAMSACWGCHEKLEQQLFKLTLLMIVAVKVTDHTIASQTKNCRTLSCTFATLVRAVL